MIPFQLVKLHPEVLLAPFNHRKELLSKFRDVLGLLNLDYVSIEIVNPDDVYMFFSSLSSINYNVISNHLWPYDGGMSPSFFKAYSSYRWEQTYHVAFSKELKRIKQGEFGFSDDLTLVRKVNNFYLLYSFASKSQSNIGAYGGHHHDELLKIGDYCYKQIRPIYLQYCDTYIPPHIHCFSPYAPGEPQDIVSTRSHLRLVVNHI